MSCHLKDKLHFLDLIRRYSKDGIDIDDMQEMKVTITIPGKDIGRNTFIAACAFAKVFCPALEDVSV